MILRDSMCASSDAGRGQLGDSQILGAVVLAYGNDNLARRVVNDLLAQGVTSESIICVQNGPARTAGEEGHASAIRTKRFEANYGYATGMNAGIRTHLGAGTRYLLLLSHDVALSHKSISRMLAAAESNPQYGVLGPVVWWREANRVFSYGGIREANSSTTHIREPHAQCDEILECDWIDGAAMLVRSDVFRDVGLLDERFFLYFEETEFCLRAQRSGWRIGVVRDALAEQSPGGASRPGAYAFLLARNGLEYARRADGGRGVLAALGRQTMQSVDLIRKAAGRRSPLRVRRESATALLASWLGTAAFAVRAWGPPPRFVPGLGDVKDAKRLRCGKTVVVSTFPPRKDGIARYASQFVAELRRHGDEVRRVGLPGSDADVCLPLGGRLRALALVPNTRRADRLVLMWHPQYFVVGRVWDRTAAYIALGVVARIRKTSIVIHEVENHALQRRSGLRAFADAVEQKGRDWFWGSAAELVFHSTRERDEFLRVHPRVGRGPRLSVREHGDFFSPSVVAERGEARRKLGVPDGWLLFLCAGFIGPHKGFDRAARAFSALPKGAATLQIVGSLLYGSVEEQRHLDELRELVDGVDGARLDERYVGDEELDLWIQAADVLLAPYRSSASSGIVARARLFGTRVIATDVGALPEQVGSDDLVVSSDDELRDAMLELVRSDAVANA